MAATVARMRAILFCLTFVGVLIPGAQPQPPVHELLQGADINLSAGRHRDQHEFKINVAAGKQECFYQRINAKTNLHFAFEVLKGADRNLDFVVFTPRGEIMDKHLWTRQGVTDMPIYETGIYAFCMDNTFSRFSSKLVYFFMSTFVPDEWQKYAAELEKIDMSIQVFSEHFTNIDKNVAEMKKIQAVVRQHSVTDWYIIRYNHTLVQNGSLIACVVVILTGAIQAYFVKRLFNVKDPYDLNKPRA